MQDVVARCSQLSIPIQAILELTYRCNLHCAHCYVDINEPDELTFEEWKGVIDQLKAAGTIYLLLTGGEIMLRSDFLEIAGYARHSGFILNLMTNCSRLTPEIAQSLAGLKPASVATSLYGASAEIHESVTRVAGSYQRTLEGIKLLVDYGLTPLVQTTVMKSNLSELAQIKSLVTGLGAEASIDIGMAPSKTGAAFPFQCEPGIEELIRCGWRPAAPAEIENNGKGLCKAGKALCSVSPHGNVFPCLMFPMRLGNLKQSKFDIIWRLEPCAELRYLRSMRRNDLYACRQCHLSAYCQRCTGIVYIESGRANGPSSSACRQAQIRWQLSQAAEVISCPRNST
jgi:radical SAM protein with 4Fe4S-binding SPASM domain